MYICVKRNNISATKYIIMYIYIYIYIHACICMYDGLYVVLKPSVNIKLNLKKIEIRFINYADDYVFGVNLMWRILNLVSLNRNYIEIYHHIPQF